MKLDWTGVKTWYVGGGTVLTPYAAKERLRRRRASKAARLARRVNRR